MLLLTKCNCIHKTCSTHAQPACCKQASIFKTCSASNAQASWNSFFALQAIPSSPQLSAVTFQPFFIASNNKLEPNQPENTWSMIRTTYLYLSTFRIYFDPCPTWTCWENWGKNSSLVSVTVYILKNSIYSTFYKDDNVVKLLKIGCQKLVSYFLGLHDKENICNVFND